MEFCEQPHFYFVLIISLGSLFSPPPVKALGQATVISHLEPTPRVQSLQSCSSAHRRAEAGVPVVTLIAHR